jgi:seryl-tRNA synthetase
MIDELETQLVREALKLPNKTHLDTPIGGEENNKVIRTVNGYVSKTKLSHIEIAEKFDLLDFGNASKLTGNKFVFLKNEAALLEMALSNWALNLVAKKGYEPMTTPDIARS